MGPTEVLGSLGDLPDVGLVDDAIHLFQVKRVGDDLRTGHDVLRVIQLAEGSQYNAMPSPGVARTSSQGQRTFQQEELAAGGLQSIGCALPCRLSFWRVYSGLKRAEMGWMGGKGPGSWESASRGQQLRTKDNVNIRFEFEFEIQFSWSTNFDSGVSA